MESINIFKTLKNACNGNSYKSFNDLQIGSYPVDRFELVESKYGVRVAVWIAGSRLYLPTRFNIVFSTQEQIDKLNETKIELYYGGKDATQRNRIILDFTEIVQ